MNQIGRSKLEKIAAESPELQAIYLKKFEEIEKRILVGEATWGELEDLIYDALTKSEEVQEIAMNFLKNELRRGEKILDMNHWFLKKIDQDSYIQTI